MRPALLAALLLVGCRAQDPPPYRPRGLVFDRPEDLSGDVLADDAVPERVKRSYCEWVRYGLDRERD